MKAINELPLHIVKARLERLQPTFIVHEPSTLLYSRTEMTMKKFIPLLLLTCASTLALSVPALASLINSKEPLEPLIQKWVSLGEDKNGVEWLVNNRSIQKNGNVVSVWIKKTFAKIQTENVKSMDIFWEVKCSSRKLTIAEINAFDSEGKLIANVPRSQINQVQTPEPFTLAGVIVDGVCQAARVQ